MSPMELDGYLTGVIVSPDLLLPSKWLDGIWGEEEPTFDNIDQAVDGKSDRTTTGVNIAPFVPMSASLRPPSRSCLFHANSWLG